MLTDVTAFLPDPGSWLMLCPMVFIISSFWHTCQWHHTPIEPLTSHPSFNHWHHTHIQPLPSHPHSTIAITPTFNHWHHTHIQPLTSHPHSTIDIILLIQLFTPHPSLNHWHHTSQFKWFNHWHHTPHSTIDITHPHSTIDITPSFNHWHHTPHSTIDITPSFNHWHHTCIVPHTSKHDPTPNGCVLVA